ncbi:MAG: 50S ribosomal protein L9 [Phycisphaerae bacterium]|nr:50S ribosomal protein L9 [Phycisphaerae bacterium]
MKLLLHADIPKLGFFGDVVNVKDGYARNYLLPQRLAVVPTESNVKAIENERAAQAEKRRLAREAKVQVAEKVNGVELTISEKANEQGHLYGSVTAAEIAKALREAGHEVKTECVKLADHITQLGETTVVIRFAEDITAEIKVTVASPDAPSDEPEQSAE